MIWPIAGLVCLVALAIVILIRWGREEKRSRIEALADDQALSNAIENWAPLIMYACGNFRRVKMFANRSRIICNRAEHHASKLNVASLVAMTAVTEICVVDVESLDKCDACESARKEWCSVLFAKIPSDVEDAQTKLAIEDFLRETCVSDWRTFLLLSKGVRFPMIDDDIRPLKG